MPRSRGLGFFPGFDQVLAAGTSAASRWIGRVTGGGGGSLDSNDPDAHIPYQEYAQRGINSVYDMFVSGQIGETRALTEIGRLRDEFLQIAAQVGHARARAGARDVDALATDVTRRIQLQSQTSSGGVRVSDVASGVGDVSLSTAAAIGIGAYLFFQSQKKTRRRRRR